MWGDSEPEVAGRREPGDDGVVHGTVAEGYGAVAAAFRSCLRDPGRWGAALAVRVDGEPVVDLWGGTADAATGRRCTARTPFLVYSVGKLVTGLCVLHLADTGVVDLDAPVGGWWPELEAGRNGRVPTRWLLTHQVGLPAFTEPIELAELLDWDTAVDRLAAQRPAWEPGTDQGYHARTFGFLAGEVLRRATGRSIGRYLADELATPLGLDLWIGLPESAQGRMARLQAVEPELDAARTEAVAAFEAAVLDERSLTHLAFLNPPLSLAAMQHPRVLGAELPAVNAVATARALAALLAACLQPVGGRRLLSGPGLAAAVRTQARGPDRVVPGAELHSGTGVALPTAREPLGGAGSFGYAGTGGSVAFAVPDRGLAVAYATNGIDTGEGAPPHRRALVEAVLRAAPEAG